MRICKSCNSFFEDEGKFCAKCGSETTEYVEAAAEPVVTVDCSQPTVVESTPAAVVESTPAAVVESTPAAVVESTPAAVVENTPVTIITNTTPTSAKVMSYVGMGLGIFGFALGIILFFGSFSSFDAWDSSVGIIFMVYAIFSMGGSIAGLCLTSKASLYGVDSTACTTGKVLSSIGLAVNILTAVLSFFGAIVSSI